MVEPEAIGNNSTQLDSAVDMESVFDPYVNALLSGALDHINYPDHLDDLLNMFLVKQQEQQIPPQVQKNNQPSPDESVPEFPVFTESSSLINIVKECDVSLNPLSYIEMEAWLKPNDTLNEEGYNLRQPKDNINVPVPHTYTSRYGRMVKQIVSPVENLSASSQDEDDLSVKSRRWSQPRQCNIHVPPVSGPSMSRLKAQKLMQKQKEQAAAQALLGLHQQNVVISDNEDCTDHNNSTTDTVDIDSESSSVTKTDEPESASDAYSDSDEIPLAKLKKDQASASTSHSDSYEIPLAKLTGKTKPYGRPYFKTKSYELYKRKQQRVFKCLKCDLTEKSQKKINEHYHSTHGLLQCNSCDKSFNTMSALRKHEYEHSNIADKYSCDDCPKRFPFSSQLKSHHKVHLTVLEFHCLHCTKSFKKKGELTKHQNIHTKKTWKCSHPNCAYICNDPRNLNAHKFTHGDKTRYVCVKCNKGFNHYMQWKQHRQNVCSSQTD